MRQTPLLIAVLNVRAAQFDAVVDNHQPLRVNSGVVRMPVQRCTDLVDQQYQNQ